MKVSGKPVLYTYVDLLGGTPPNFYIRVMYQELSCWQVAKVGRLRWQAGVS